MLEIRSDMQTALAAGDTSRPQFIRVTGFGIQLVRPRFLAGGQYVENVQKVRFDDANPAIARVEQ